MQLWPQRICVKLGCNTGQGQGWASPGLLDPGTHLRTWGTYGVVVTRTVSSMVVAAHFIPLAVAGAKESTPRIASWAKFSPSLRDWTDSGNQKSHSLGMTRLAF
jgi:hypothetical protein